MFSEDFNIWPMRQKKRYDDDSEASSQAECEEE